MRRGRDAIGDPELLGLPSPGEGRGASGGTADPCHRDHPARPGVKVERPQAARSPWGPSQLVGAGGRGRTTLTPASVGPGGIPAGRGHRPNAAGCRVPAAPRPI